MILTLPPGVTATIQLKTRTIGSDTPGADVGSPIVGSASGVTYTFALGDYATGDYWCQLSGVSSPAAGPFPVRDDVAYFIPWRTIDSTIVAVPSLPIPIAGLCQLLVATNEPGCRAWAVLASDNNAVDGTLVSQQVTEDITDESGNATLTLIQYGQFTDGGRYRVRVASAGRVISSNVLVVMPNTTTANLAELTPIG